MTVTQLLHATAVPVQAAPPSRLIPNSNGVAISTPASAWQVITDSPAYAPGSTADLIVEVLVAGTWTFDASVGGFTLGSYVSDDTKLATTVNQFTISSDFPTATRVRVNVTRAPAGTLASLTVNGIS